LKPFLVAKSRICAIVGASLNVPMTFPLGSLTTTIVPDCPVPMAMFSSFEMVRPGKKVRMLLLLVNVGELFKASCRAA
jgi:hypothetical protein